MSEVRNDNFKIWYININTTNSCRLLWITSCNTLCVFQRSNNNNKKPHNTHEQLPNPFIKLMQSVHKSHYSTIIIKLIISI